MSYIEYIIKENNDDISIFYDDYDNKLDLLTSIKDKILGTKYKDIISKQKLEGCLLKQNFEKNGDFIFWKINNINTNKNDNFKEIIESYKYFFDNVNNKIKEIIDERLKNINVRSFVSLKLNKNTKNEYSKLMNHKYNNININKKKKILKHFSRVNIDILDLYDLIDHNIKTSRDEKLWPDKILKNFYDFITKRVINLKDCAKKKINKGNLIIGNWMFNEANLEARAILNKNIKNILKIIQFSPNNIKYNSEFNKIIENNVNLYNNYISKQTEKIFLLGSVDNILKYSKYKNLFYVLPSIMPEKDLKCSNYVEWSYLINMLYLLIINNSDNDIASIILLDKSKTFFRKRIPTDISEFREKKLTGFLIAPYYTNNSKSIFKKMQKLTSYPNNTIILGIFENENPIINVSHSIFNYYSIYDMKLKNVSYGQLYPDYTILYQELKTLFGGRMTNTMYIYYDEREEFQDKLFISKFDNLEDEKGKYPHLKKGQYVRKIIGKKKQIVIYSKDNKILLQSINEDETLDTYKSK